jgi:hypothetical protein
VKAVPRERFDPGRITHAAGGVICLVDKDLDSLTVYAIGLGFLWFGAAASTPAPPASCRNRRRRRS